MTFVSSRRLSAALIVLGGTIAVVHSPQAGAQTAFAPVVTPAVVASKPAADEAHKFLAFFQIQKLCTTPLALKVQNASLESIAAHVRKTLPLPAPPVEVRGALSMRLTFDLKESTVGAALKSAGALAGAKLWVFPDHLLLAPETALSVEEQDAIKAEMASQETQIGVTRRECSPEDIRNTTTLSRLIVGEIKARSEGTKAPLANVQTEPSLKTTFGQLSLDSQMLLQELVSKYNRYNASRADPSTISSPPFTLSSDTVIQLNLAVPQSSDSRREDNLQLSNTGGEDTMGWTLIGGGWNRGGGILFPDQPGSPTAPPFLDPSAGKS